jgi:hypothetical protein
VHAALKAMSQGLGDKPWCTGNHFTLADVAVGCALGYLDFRFPHIDWRGDHPNLAKLHDKLATRPSFIDTRRRPPDRQRRVQVAGGEAVGPARQWPVQPVDVVRPVGAPSMAASSAPGAPRAAGWPAGARRCRRCGARCATGGDLAGCFRPAACTSSCSACSVFWWKR